LPFGTPSVPDLIELPLLSPWLPYHFNTHVVTFALAPGHKSQSDVQRSNEKEIYVKYK
jgi:hypothetical protein